MFVLPFSCGGQIPPVGTRVTYTVVEEPKYHRNIIKTYYNAIWCVSLFLSLSLSNTCICCIVVCTMDMLRWSTFIMLCRICDVAATLKPPKSPKPHFCYFAVNHSMRVRPNGPWQKDSKTGRPRAENVMMLGLRLGWALQRCRNGEDAVADAQPHAGKLRQLALWCKRLEPKSPLIDTMNVEVLRLP